MIPKWEKFQTFKHSCTVAQLHEILESLGCEHSFKEGNFSGPEGRDVNLSYESCIRV